MELIKTEQKTPLNLIKEVIDIPLDHELSKRKISSEIDLKLGFNIKKIEEKMRAQALAIKPGTFFDEWGPILHGGAQTWIGLDFQVLQCTYHDLKNLFSELPMSKVQRVVDLGAGYGRMGLFLHWYYPQKEFLGYELVRERVQEGMRIYEQWGLKRHLLIEKDLTKLCELPEAELYFIYDFGSEKDLKLILERLLNLPHRSLVVVKGRICRNLMLKDSRWENEIKLKKSEDIYLYQIG